MDTTYQDRGVFRAFGLVHELLRNGVTIHWVILPGKSYGDVDLVVGAVTDLRTAAAYSNVAYRGGPFIVDAADVAVAQPIVDRWLLGNAGLVVHRADTGFVADIGRRILSPPTIAVFADGNEDIAFDYLNAAAISQAMAKPSAPGNRVTVGTASATPAVTSAPAGNSLVAGTSTEPAGAEVQVFVNDLFVGTTTVQAGGTWSLAPVAIPPAAGTRAAVTAAGKGTSVRSASLAAGALPPGGTSATPAIVSPIREGDGIVNGTSTEADGTTVRLFRNGALLSTVVVSSGKWSAALPGAAAGGDRWNATATAPSKTESALSSLVIAVPVPPTVTPPLAAGATTVAGVYRMTTGATLDVVRTRAGVDAAVGTASVNNTAWSAAVPAVTLQAGDVVSASPTSFPFPPGKSASYPCPGPSCCPECLPEADVQGPTSTSHTDGRLFDPAGRPRFCQLMSMHYGAPGDTEVVAEVRRFLGFQTHAFFECQAVNAFENVALEGRYLTTAGLVSANVGADGPFYYFGSDIPFAQAHGDYRNPGGSEESYSLAAGSAYHNANVVHVSGANVAGHGTKDIWMTGFLDGDPDNGKVSYLGGHRYDVALPLSANPKSQGTRYFLDSLYEAPCVCSSADVVVAKTGPAQTFGSDITYTITYTNTGGTFATDVRIEDVIPPGSIFLGASAGGTFDGTKVVWPIGTVLDGASGSVQVTVRFPTFGTYTDTAGASYKSGQIAKTSAPSTVTTVYCDAAQVLPEVDPPPQTGLRSVKSGSDVRITWTDQLPAEACGVEYRIYGAPASTCPDNLGPYQLLGSTVAPAFDHVGALNDGLTWYYLVVMSNGFTNGRFDAYYGP